MHETSDWIEDYKNAFKAANPHWEGEVRVQLWTAGWYRVAFPGRDFGPRKHRKSEIMQWTERLKAKVANAAVAEVDAAGRAPRA